MTGQLTFKWFLLVDIAPDLRYTDIPVKNTFLSLTVSAGYKAYTITIWI